MKIKLACNYLLELQEALDEKLIDVDYVKFPAINGDMEVFEKALKTGKTVLYHSFPPSHPNLGAPDYIEQFEEEIIKDNIKRAGIDYLSGHLTCHMDTYNLNSENHKDIDREILLNNFRSSINHIKKVMNMNIALENSPIFPSYKNIPVCGEPEFIKEVVYSTDSNFLFDIAHGKINCQVNGWSMDEYLSRLPLDRLVEIHISGVRVREDGKILDAHTSIVEEETYDILKKLIKIPTLKTVTLEYCWSSDGYVNNYEKSHLPSKLEMCETLKRIKEIVDEENKNRE